jgi:hypothetical protein
MDMAVTFADRQGDPTSMPSCGPLGFRLDHSWNAVSGTKEETEASNANVA